MKFVFGAKPKAPIDAFVSLVKLGESLGFDGAWVPDQTFFPDPFVAIALSTTATRHIELVIGVANPYTRHPVQVSRAAATLDNVAPGRIALGYGAGNRRELIVPLGKEQDAAARRCREAIQVARSLLRGEMVHYRSETLVAEGVQLEMPPHPKVPIYLAARGPLILQAAGELADVAVIGALLSPDGIRYAVDQVRLGAECVGRKLDDVGLMSWISCYITDDKARWIEFYRPNAAHILAGAPAPVFDALKLSNGFMEELKGVYAEGGSAGAARLVSDDLVLQLAAIGNAGEVTEQLQSAAELGVNQFGILVNASTVQESERMLRRFSKDVMPHLKAT